MDGIDGQDFGNLPSFSLDDQLGSGGFDTQEWGSSDGAFDTSSFSTIQLP